jgi:hypothetical protein
MVDTTIVLGLAARRDHPAGRPTGTATAIPFTALLGRAALNVAKAVAGAGAAAATEAIAQAPAQLTGSWCGLICFSRASTGWMLKAKPKGELGAERWRS